MKGLLTNFAWESLIKAREAMRYKGWSMCFLACMFWPNWFDLVS